MELLNINEMEVHDGMSYACEMLKSSYIADVMEELYGGRSIVHLQYISAGIKHTIRNGKPYYYKESDVEQYQRAIKEIGVRLMNVEITADTQSQSDYPLCYGDTFIEKFKVLRKIIVLPYLFEDIMGRTTRWQKMHLSDKAATKYYNQFSEAELEEINNGIRSIALRLCSIKLIYNSVKE